MTDKAVRASERTKGRRLFWAGYLGAVGLVGLFQDVLGKERYLRLARGHWTSGWISGPLEITCLVWAAIAWKRAANEPNREGQ